jgi:peptidylprolyl isomerase
MFALWIAAALAASWPVSDELSSEPWATRDGGLEVQDVKVGDGTEVVPGSDVQVHYVGRLASGEIFDSSVERGETFGFRVGAGQVIAGWEQGLVGMKIGGVRRLVIPAALGYGNRSAGSIPPGATLYFEVELFEVRAPRTPPEAPWTAERLRRGPKGLQLADLAKGEGNKAKKGERVCVDLAVWANGELVDHTYAKPECWWFRYDHSLVMEGLTLGMKGMREGGRRQVQVPAALATSQRAEDAQIPAGVDLVLDIELVKADR